MDGARDSNGARGLLAVLLFLALAVRLIVPAGYMPTATTQGVVVSLCTADGLRTSVALPAQPDGGGDHGLPHDRQPAPCAFAALAAPALEGGTAPAIAAPPRPVREVAPPPPADADPPSIARRLPPLRGPPATA